MWKYENYDKFSHNIIYRLDWGKKVIDVLNKYLPENKQIKESEMEKQGIDTYTRYIKTSEFMDEVEKNYKATDKELVQDGLKREVGFFVGTKEEKEDFIKDVSTYKGAKEYCYERMIETFEVDSLEAITSDEDKMVEKYMINPLKYESYFVTDSRIEDQKLNKSDNVKKIYNNQLTMIQNLADPCHAIRKQANPFNSIIPELPQITDEVLMKAEKEIAELGNLPDAPGFLKDTKMLANYRINLTNMRVHDILKNEFTNLKKENKVPENLMMSAKYTVEGREVKYFDYVEAVKNNLPRTITERSKEEIKAFKDELYSGKALSYSALQRRDAAGEIILVSEEDKTKTMLGICDEVAKFGDDMVKTNSVFSRDTKEFKAARDLSSNFAKEWKEANIDKNDNKKVMEFFKTKKADLEKIQKAIDDYAKMKTEKTKKEIAKGKTPSERSETRLKLANGISNYLKENLCKDKLEYKEIPPQPYRDHKVTEQVKSEIKASEKANEKVNTKDLSKTKEMEMSKSNNQ